MVVSPFVIRHNKQLARWILREKGPQKMTALAREHAGTQALAEREHVLLCGFGRVGQNVARVLEKMGHEFLAVDADPERTRAARQAGDPVVYGDASEPELLEKIGLEKTSIVVISFSNPTLALRILQEVRKIRANVPVLVRTQDDSFLPQLQQAGATSVVPETFEAGLTLVWHALVLLGEPVPRVIETISDIRANRYGLLRGVIRPTEEATTSILALSEAQNTVVLPPGAWAVGKTIEELQARDIRATVSAIRRDGIVGRDPAPGTVLKEGDIVVLYGVPEALEHGETVLLMG
jgi:CPA2 family monovalent cation:H+ antiporter-2